MPLQTDNLGAPSEAQSSGPSITPALRVETGMHTAMVTNIAVDAKEHYLVTGSSDKTIRVWDLGTGTLRKVLRPPIGEGYEGRIDAVAISPDGTTIAATGWTGPAWGPGYSIYLFDRASGQLTNQIFGSSHSITELGFSPDGRHLALGFSGSAGILIIDKSVKSVAHDKNYFDSVSSLDFDRTGRLVTSSLDGFLRLYDAEFRLVAKAKAPGGKQPHFVRFSPDGRRVAVGFKDSQLVNVLSGDTLNFLHAPNTCYSDRGGNLSRVAWSTDGSQLYAGGHSTCQSGGICLFRWNNAGHGKCEQFQVSTSTLIDLLPLNAGRLAFGAADPSVGVIGSDGKKVWEHPGEILDYRHSARQFKLSHDGTVVEFNFTPLNPTTNRRSKTVQFDLIKRQPVFDPPFTPDLAAPLVQGNPNDWEYEQRPLVRGRILTLPRGDMCLSLALAPKEPGFLLGMHWSLRYYENSEKVRWEVTIPESAWAVNLSGDGRYAIAALGDGTIRWYRADNGREVLALFMHPDGKHWVVWTPEGIFDAAPGAEHLIGYHINQGKGQNAKFVSAKQLFERYYRPNVIAHTLQADGNQLVTEAVRELGDVRSVLAAGLPPKVELLSAREVNTEGEYTFTVRVLDQGGGIGKLIYRIDGVEIQGRPADIPSAGRDTVSRRFTLPAGKHTLSATAQNTHEVESEPVSVELEVKPRSEPPILFVLAVGIRDYRDHALAEGVRFAAHDAATVARLFETQGVTLYREVRVLSLRDHDATREKIRATMADLAARIGPDDVFVLYLAGHGAAFEHDYHFVPWEARYTSRQALREQSLDEKTLRSLLANIKANKTLVLLDSCSSGAFGFERGRALGDKEAIDRLARLSGRAIIAATADDKMALEGEGGHGAFTFALLEGLGGAADRNGNGTVEVGELADYIEDRLPEITRKWGYEQFPFRDIQGGSFVVLPNRE